MVLMYIITGVLVLISVLIQGHSSFDILRIAGVKPDLTFIIIVYFAYSFGSLYGEITGFFGGLLHDFVSNSPLGMLAFPKMALGFIIGFFSRNIFKENIITIFILLFFSSIAKGLITMILCYLFHHTSLNAIIDIILPEAFYNALIAPPLFYLLDKIFEQEIAREGK